MSEHEAEIERLKEQHKLELMEQAADYEAQLGRILVEAGK